MDRSVSSHIDLPVERLSAYPAGIRTDTGVASLVSQHIGRLTEPFPAHVTLIRLRAGMRHHVFAEVGLSEKAHLALVALEGLGVIVDESVIGQAARSLEPLQAELALVLLDGGNRRHSYSIYVTVTWRQTSTSLLRLLLLKRLRRHRSCMVRVPERVRMKAMVVKMIGA